MRLVKLSRSHAQMDIAFELAVCLMILLDSESGILTEVAQVLEHITYIRTSKTSDSKYNS